MVAIEFCNLEVILTGPPDVYSFAVFVNAFPPVVLLPPLPALATIEVNIHSNYLSARFADFLPCIRSAPALSSITFKYPKSTPVNDDPASDEWINVDKWLATHVKAKRSLTAILTPWPEGNSKLGEWLPEFRKAGGELKVETGARSL